MYAFASESERVGRREGEREGREGGRERGRERGRAGCATRARKPDM